MSSRPRRILPRAIRVNTRWRVKPNSEASATASRLFGNKSHDQLVSDKLLIDLVISARAAAGSEERHGPRYSVVRPDLVNKKALESACISLRSASRSSTTERSAPNACKSKSREYSASCAEALMGT